MEEELIKDLSQLGLNQYEAKVYLALLQRSSLATSEVATISKVPRARTYDILESLLEKGLASLKPGKYKKYSAVDIDTFKSKLIINNERLYNEKREKIHEVSLSLKKKIESIYPPGNFMSDPFEYIEVIKDPYQIHRKFCQLFREAQKEVLAFVKPPYTGFRNEQTEHELEILRGKISVKGIYEIPEEKAERERRFENIKQLVEAGEEARVLPELPIKMVIFDEKTVFFVLEDPAFKRGSSTSQVIEHRSLAKTLKIVFDTLWNQAQDYHILLEG